jgi:hypothetical protein
MESQEFGPEVQNYGFICRAAAAGLCQVLMRPESSADHFS